MEDTIDKMRENAKRYYSTEKGKETLRRYRQSERGKKARQRYAKSEKGRETRLRYYMATREKQKAIRTLFLGFSNYLKQNPEATFETYCIQLSKETSK